MSFSHCEEDVIIRRSNPGLDYFVVLAWFVNDILYDAKEYIRIQRRYEQRNGSPAPSHQFFTRRYQNHPVARLMNIFGLVSLYVFAKSSKSLRTSSTCPATFTSSYRFAISPAGVMMTVVRAMPTYSRPMNFFLFHTPYAVHTA